MELVLRQVGGNAFQNFFNRFMGRVHGDEFFPVRPHGNLGDGGVDGAYGLGDVVYQCYGADNGSLGELSKLKAKIQRDYDSARATVPQMRAWVFAHNLVDGLPQPIHALFGEMKERNPGCDIRHFGLESFRRYLQQMSALDAEALLGRFAMEEIDAARLPQVVSGLVSSIMSELGGHRTPLRTPRDVPESKLADNRVGPLWSDKIAEHVRHSPMVEQLIAHHGNPMAAVDVPAHFKDRYLDLRTQGMASDAVLDEMYEGLLRRIPEAVRRSVAGQTAAMALLACMVERCVVLDDVRVPSLAEVAP